MTVFKLDNESAFTLIEECGDVRTIMQFKSMEDYAEYRRVVDGDLIPDIEAPNMSDAAPLESGQWYMCNMGAETRPVLHHGKGYWSFDRNNEAAGMIENLTPLYKMARG